MCFIKKCSLFVLAIYIMFCFKVLNFKNEGKEIDNIFIDGIPNYSEYIGYIEIPRLDYKRGIVSGISNEILNKNKVGMIENKNIVLAGHNNFSVFMVLHLLKISDEIYLFLDHKYKYVVTNIEVVSKHDLNHLNSDLVLITCMINPNNRLIVSAKKSI